MKRVWCPRWPSGCRLCNTKTRKHMGQGYCSRCYRREMVAGRIVRKKHQAKIRVREGVTQHFCFRCESWKNETEFFRRGNGHRTMCTKCRAAQKREIYAKEQELLRAKRRDRSALITASIRLADKKRKRKSADPWNERAGIIPIEHVRTWIERAFVLDPDLTWLHLALVTGIDERRLRRIGNGTLPQKVTSVDTAERVAVAADAMDEFREVTMPGIPGWSKHSDYCLRCGRYDIPAHAMGHCRRCYCVVWWHKQRGRVAPPPSNERWSRSHMKCVNCGRTDSKHQGHGFCGACYTAYRRAKRRQR